MNALRITLLVAALLLTASVDLFAQQEPPVAPGDRVRVTAPGTFWPRVCSVMALQNDTLVLDFGDRAGPIHLALADVEQLEVSQGRKSRLLKGLAIGFFVGATTGAVVGFASGDDPPGLVSFSAEDKAGLGAALLGGLGLAIGAIIGSHPSEQWQEVPVDRLRVSLTPHKTPALTVSMSLRM